MNGFIFIYTTSCSLDADINPIPCSDFHSLCPDLERPWRGVCSRPCRSSGGRTNYTSSATNLPVLRLSVHNLLPAIALQSDSLPARSIINTRRNTPKWLKAESPLCNLSRCEDVPRNEISDHIRPPLCLNLSPVVGIGFSALNTQSSRSSAGNSIRKIPLQRYAAQATIVAISASIQ